MVGCGDKIKVDGAGAGCGADGAAEAKMVCNNAIPVLEAADAVVDVDAGRSTCTVVADWLKADAKRVFTVMFVN